MSLFLVPRRPESCKCDRCDNRLPIDDIGRIDIRLCETCWWIEQVAQWEPCPSRLTTRLDTPRFSSARTTPTTSSAYCWCNMNDQLRRASPRLDAAYNRNIGPTCEATLAVTLAPASEPTGKGWQ